MRNESGLTGNQDLEQGGAPMAGTIWYAEYENKREEVEQLRARYNTRCKELGIEPGAVTEELWREMIARVVHESNWQEDLFLDPVRTKELADAVFDEVQQIAGPHLDMNGVVDSHRLRVLRMKRAGKTPAEIAAYNLSLAHVALAWVGQELAARQTVSLMAALEQVRRAFGTEPERNLLPEQVKEGFDLVERLQRSKHPVYGPLSGTTTTEGELVNELMKVEFSCLVHPMKVEYLHFLHRLTTMGLISTKKCGVFRRTSVHIPANPDLYFPLPSAVPKLVEDFCQHFPTISPATITYDPIREAARVSHAFVHIHPYADGNGRLSRLLMNLILWKHFPPVYLKADKKGRHRYVQALKRADRGNFTPLACLIAMSLISIYQRLLASVIGPFDQETIHPIGE